MNRILKERGLSREIARMHKDLLADEIATKRLAGIRVSHQRHVTHIYTGRAAGTKHREWVQEIVGYMGYFSNLVELIRQCFACLARISCGKVDAGRRMVCDLALESLVIHVQRHPNIFAKGFLLFLGLLLRGDNQWENDAMDRILDQASVAELLLETLMDIASNGDMEEARSSHRISHLISRSLRDRTGGRHHAYTPRFDEACAAVRMRMLRLQVDEIMISIT